ncbi:MAG: citramalate synthase [Ancrocorticia sp.]|uniref:citramalate synthase n=1 Tax=Ancrocorticia sp. TaxID=2593684 RepID=UPI003F915E5E
MKIDVYDVTLRDGAQQEGINLSVADKFALMPLIESIGADYIEGGWPGAIPRDTEFFGQAGSAPLERATLAAFGATRKAGVKAADDGQIQGLLDSGAPVLTLVAKSDIRHVEQALRTTGEENLAMVRDSVEYLRSQGREVMVDVEHFFDGFRFDPDYTSSVVAECFSAGATCVILCDTNGGSLPSDVTRVVTELQERLVRAGFEGAKLGIHAHDDGGCAVANSIAAIEAGCRQVQGTINGYGERTGNANLLTILANLALKTEYETVSAEQLARLSSVSHAASEITNISPYARQPYVGVSAFAHKAGLHASAIRVNPDLYQHIDPLAVGNDMRMLVSDMAGRASIELKTREFGIDLSDNPEALGEITGRVKAAEAAGYTYDAADASFELIVRDVMGDRKQYFIIEAWRANISTVNGDGHSGSASSADSSGETESGFDGLHSGSTFSEATVKIYAGGRRYMRVGEGVGPVDALDQALRTALNNVYSELAGIELIDFKVRILDTHRGTEATTRVMIELSDGQYVWRTVGVGDDVIEASWEALTEGYEYGLMRAGVTPWIGGDRPEG